MIATSHTNPQKYFWLFLLTLLIVVLFSLPFVYVVVCMRHEGDIKLFSRPLDQEALIEGHASTPSTSHTNSRAYLAEIVISDQERSRIDPGLQVTLRISHDNSRRHESASGSVWKILNNHTSSGSDDRYKLICLIRNNETGIQRMLDLNHQGHSGQTRIMLNRLNIWDMLKERIKDR